VSLTPSSLHVRRHHPPPTARTKTKRSELEKKLKIRWEDGVRIGELEGEEVVFPHMATTIEWVISSPPPLHGFDEVRVCLFVVVFGGLLRVCSVIFVSRAASACVSCSHTSFPPARLFPRSLLQVPVVKETFVDPNYVAEAH
jgi:hypothetical protein